MTENATFRTTRFKICFKIVLGKPVRLQYLVFFVILTKTSELPRDNPIKTVSGSLIFFGSKLTSGCGEVNSCTPRDETNQTSRRDHSERQNGAQFYFVNVNIVLLQWQYF